MGDFLLCSGISATQLVSLMGRVETALSLNFEDTRLPLPLTDLSWDSLCFKLLRSVVLKPCFPSIRIRSASDMPDIWACCHSIMICWSESCPEPARLIPCELPVR